MMSKIRMRTIVNRNMANRNLANRNMVNPMNQRGQTAETGVMPHASSVRTASWRALSCLLVLYLPLLTSSATAQSVCLPAPRLLTTMPMGGTRGTELEVVVSGQHLDEVRELRFSDPGITAVAKTDSQGKPIANRFQVTIRDSCQPGIYEARLVTRLGVSTPRAFNVSDLPELTSPAGNTSLEKAMELPVNSICNAAMTRQAIDYFKFQSEAGKRIIVDCAATGIDSKLKPVVILADADGSDLMVERRGGLLDFDVPEDGTYVVKVHDLTFNGGPFHFYRLSLREVGKDEAVQRMPSTKTVNACSWPPAVLAKVCTAESEPNDESQQAHTIQLPCHIRGSFFPAADVDQFEFEAKKGEVWWVEVASERLGLPTDPSIVVQRVVSNGSIANEKVATPNPNDPPLTADKTVDVAEFGDIGSPVKVSSNGYSYDGPPYNAGTSDVLGKLEIKQDGIYRLKLRDLFGGTRNHPENIYHLVIRQAQPDFAVVAWGLHMNLRNGDRNALSKPIALRGGATMPIEVVAIRRDGFNGPIRLEMQDLPAGVKASGLTIPAGKSRGIMLVTAHPKAPTGFSSAKFFGEAKIAGKSVKRKCHWASMSWPVANSWSEVPKPRLIGDLPVSVTNDELSPLSITPVSDKFHEAVVGSVLEIPLTITRRCDFSGNAMSLKTFGAGFERNATFDAPLNFAASQITENLTAKLNLASLKTKPGEYTIAFYGSAVAKYQDYPAGVSKAEAAFNETKQRLAKVDKEIAMAKKRLTTVDAAKRSELESQVKELNARQTTLRASVARGQRQVGLAKNRAKSKDIVEIYSSSPIKIRVLAAEAEAGKTK